MAKDLRNARIVQHVRRWPRRVVITVAVVAIVLIGARIALPFVIKQRVNARLENVPGYVGHVDSIGVSLFRGAYSMTGIAIYRQSGQVREPFLLARHLDFSLAWRELLHRKIVSDITLERAEINFVKAATEEESQKKVDRRWNDVVKDLFPIDITFFEMTNSSIRYVDKTKAPHIDVFVKAMHLRATGLRNRPAETGVEFPAEITVEGDTLGGGRLKSVVVAEPLAEQPHFHLSAKIDNVNLPALNESMRAIAGVDVSKGKFQMAAEMAGRDGGFQGYVKPFFTDLDFRNLDDKQRGIGSRIWEHVVAGLAWLVKNKSRDQVGTRIPFQGRFGDPKVGLLTTIANTFRHGFVRAFNPTVEGTLHADEILPNGQSANGENVASVKTDSPPPRTGGAPDETKAGAPTGRPSEPRPKK